MPINEIKAQQILRLKANQPSPYTGVLISVDQFKTYELRERQYDALLDSMHASYVYKKCDDSTDWIFTALVFMSGVLGGFVIGHR